MVNQELIAIFNKSPLTKYGLAKSTGLAETTVGRWAEGKTNIGLETMELIADELDVSITLTRRRNHARTVKKNIARKQRNKNRG